mgnify:CR=1 FL=1
MKKIPFVFTLIMAASLTMTAICPAQEANTPDAQDIQTTEETNMPDAQDAFADTLDAQITEETNIAVGAWRGMKQTGGDIAGKTFGGGTTFYIYPDGTISDGSFKYLLSADLQEDGSFTIDTSAYDELEGYTITGEITPLEEKDLEEYNINKETYSDMLDFSYSANKMLVTVTMPDPKNPLAATPATVSLCLLRYTDMRSYFKTCLYGKIWKSGDNVLEISEEGKLSLNNGQAEASIYVNTATSDGEDEYSDFISSLRIPVKVSFYWKEGGHIYYAPVLLTADNKIYLQELGGNEEMLILELESVISEPEAEEDADVEIPVSEDAAPAQEETPENPFEGTWYASKSAKNGVEIPLEDLLLCEGLDVIIDGDGSISLTFSNGFTTVIIPEYDGNSLTARYTEYDNDMTWTAVLNDDGTVTAMYDVYVLEFENK